MAITAQSSYNLIKKKNVTADFVLLASDSVDPTTGTRTKGAATDETVFIVPPVTEKRYSNGEGVPEGLTLFRFSPYLLTFTPELGQTLEYNSEIWTLEHKPSEFTNINGATVLYEFGARN